MANRYIWSGATGTGTGADWANAHTTTAASITASTAGDTHFWAHDHAESTAAALTLTPKGTAAAPDKFLCVNRAGSVPPVAADLATTASITTTGNNALNVNNGYFYAYGLILNAGSGSTTGSVVLTAGGQGAIWEACAFNLMSTFASVNSNICPTSTGRAFSYWRNCSVSFGNAVQYIRGDTMGKWTWENLPGAAAITAGSTYPTSLTGNAASGTSVIRWRGLDLSALGSGKTLISAGICSGSVELVNCKLGASVTVAAVPSGPQLATVDAINCDSSGTNYRTERYQYQGTLTTEIVIVRTGGASDGTTPFSWKIVPTSNNELISPFETLEGSIWNDTTGSAKTLTVHCVTDNVTLTDAEIWLEVEYLGSSATPVSSFVNDGVATVLTTGASQASSTETWTTTGLTTPLKQKLEVTFTPQMKGPIRWRVKYAKTSTTVYVCPKAELS